MITKDLGLMIRFHSSFFFLFTIYVQIVGNTFAARPPLGVITAIDDPEITVEFDSTVQFTVGSLLAIYALGSLERHPLTGKVILMRPEKVAEAQIVTIREKRQTARITWKAQGIELTVGMDVLPQDEADSLSISNLENNELPEMTAPIQETFKLDLPEGRNEEQINRQCYLWRIDGPIGSVGYLGSRVTYTPSNTWFTPGEKTKATVVVTSITEDSQSYTLKIPCKTKSFDKGWQNRELKPMGDFGSQEKLNLSVLSRNHKGEFWGCTRNSILKISPHWRQAKDFSLAEDTSLFLPISLAPYNNTIHVLDYRSRSVLVLSPSGVTQKKYGSFNDPSDLVIARDGTVFIADRKRMSIEVYESMGNFNSSHRGSDLSFENPLNDVTKLAINNKDELFALDPTSSQIHRFNSARNPLPPWEIRVNRKETPIDIEWHPNRFLLVLLSNGRIMTMKEDGTAGMSMESASATFSIENLGIPDSLFVDLAGEVFVTHSRSGLISRYNSSGSLLGIRGASLWRLEHFAADGSGRLYGINPQTGLINYLDQEGWLIGEIGGRKNFRELKLKKPIDLAVSPDGADVVVLDGDSNEIIRFTLTESEVYKPIKKQSENVRYLTKPKKVVIDSKGRTFVLDSKSKRIVVYNRNGDFLFEFGHTIRSKEQENLKNPSLIAVHPKGHFVFVYDSHSLKRFELDQHLGKVLSITVAGSKGNGPCQFKKPQAMACDFQGLLYVADKSRRDLQVIEFAGKDPKTIYTRRYEDWGMTRVHDMALDPNGRLYLSHPKGVTMLGW